jgi:hypothetical protein
VPPFRGLVGWSGVFDDSASQAGREQDAFDREDDCFESEADGAGEASHWVVLSRRLVLVMGDRESRGGIRTLRHRPARPALTIHQKWVGGCASPGGRSSNFNYSMSVTHPLTLPQCLVCGVRSVHGQIVTDRVNPVAPEGR